MGKILHETEVIIHGVSIVDLDWAEVIGIRFYIHFSKTWGIFHLFLVKKVIYNSLVVTIKYMLMAGVIDGSQCRHRSNIDIPL